MPISEIYLEKVKASYQQFFVAVGFMGYGHTDLMERDFEKFLDEAISLADNMPEELRQLYKDFNEYKAWGKSLTLQDKLYWDTDHMRITLSDIEEVKGEAEQRIRNWYKNNEDLEWDYLDLVRRMLHGIDLAGSAYDDIRAYLDEAILTYKVATN